MVAIESRQPHRRRMGAFHAAFMSAPHLLVAALIGLAFYNPTRWSIVHLADKILFDGLGVVDGTAWYSQPVYWAGLIGVLVIAGVAWFHWEIVRNEWVYFVALLMLVVVINGLILSLATVFVHEDLLTKDWVRWQIAPAIFAAIYASVKIPKIRREYTGATTVSGGTLEVHEVGETPYDHYVEDET